MDTTTLSESSAAKLTHKYFEFRKFREDLSMFLVSFIGDYMKLQNDEPSRRRRYLRKKYGLFTPRINYQFNTGSGFCWSVRNIAIVLGRDRSSILRVLSRMCESDEWRERVTSLRSETQSYEGGNLDVYHQDIFDVILDFYEEEYLLRFARPRHGDDSSAPSIEELRAFWRKLQSMESIQKRVLLPTGGGGIHFLRWLVRLWRWLRGSYFVS